MVLDVPKLKKENIKLKERLKKSRLKKTKIKKILKKPSTKIPTYSATKVVKEMAGQNIRLVKEPEEPKEMEYPEPRSLFFKKELVKERKWLS